MEKPETTEIPSQETQATKEEPKKEKRVINEVEDTKAISEGKQKGDKQFQIDQKQAIREYSNTLQLIRDIKESYEGDKGSEFLKFVLENEIKIVSNLALCNTKLKNYEKAIDFDLEIINRLDTYFDKSYIRIIQNYQNLGDLKKALDNYFKFNSTFSKDCHKKYEEFLSKFLATIEKDEKLSKLLKRTSKTSSNKISRIVWVLALVVLMVLGVFLYNQFASRNNIPQPQTDNIASESYESNVTQNSEKAETNNLQQEGAEDL